MEQIPVNVTNVAPVQFSKSLAVSRYRLVDESRILRLHDSPVQH